MHTYMQGCVQARVQRSVPHSILLLITFLTVLIISSPVSFLISQSNSSVNKNDLKGN